MVKNSCIILLVLLFTQSLSSFGQDIDRYIILFTDKDNSTYNINLPEAFLSNRAIQRRFKNQVIISEEDLPVNTDYITEIKDLGINVAHSTKWLNGILVEATAAQIASAELLSFVESTERVAFESRYNTRVARNNKLESLQNVLETNEGQETQNTAMQNHMLGVDVMHNMGYRGDGIFIAVLDAGFQNVNNLPYFEPLYTENRIKYTYDFVTNNTDVYALSSHGTWVLSCIAANEEGIMIGTAPNVEVALMITEDEVTEYKIEEYNWVIGAEKADSMGVDIITSSLGYTTFDDPTMDYQIDDLDGNTFIVSQGAKIAASKGIVVLNSASNLGNDSSWNGLISAPADVDELIAVGAIGADSTRASFSSTGPTADGRTKPDAVALGVSTVVGYNYTTLQPIQLSGTSFSTPLITGLTAGLMQAFPDLMYTEIIDLVISSGHLNGNPNNLLGSGIPSFTRARTLIVANEPIRLYKNKLYPNPATNELNVLLDEFHDNNIQMNIYDVNGQLVQQHHVMVKDNNEVQQLDVAHLLPGLYMLKIKGAQNVHNYRFLKQ